MPLFDTAFRNDLRTLLLWRRDVRRFRPDPLPEGLLDELLELATLAPSVGLSQPWRFVLVEDEGRRALVRRSFERANAEALAGEAPERAALHARLKLAGLDAAPCQIAVFADAQTRQGHGLGRRTMPETLAYSAVLAIHTLWLAARAAGIGLGWVSILEPREVSRALDVPESWLFIGYLCLGFPEAEHETPELEREGWESRREARSTILRR
ncbi:5,6-dimethylbenzimidazole synthase [Aureimonas populi]|uniref:5,6-dimethylbenzimidazole synthase n=1 Tax=Aureimonas populi TaxID=1701758 RepID=A0ABW5CNK1_9HYPH|nr:5,6-dimethylbenzimidazole synthase [Aureimonas populi]